MPGPAGGTRQFIARCAKERTNQVPLSHNLAEAIHATSSKRSPHTAMRVLELTALTTATWVGGWPLRDPASAGLSSETMRRKPSRTSHAKRKAHIRLRRALSAKL
eukprot:4517384-Amphidinium_carterae.2